MHRRSLRGFTLIELLVVIAIIAVLSVVVVLSLNPAELLRQSRDANRISDMATLTTAVNLYLTDSGGIGSLGAASTSYMSMPDPSATSTAGDQCQGLGLPALATSSGQNWKCGASSTFRKTDGTGWIPVPWNTLSSGSPLGQLPVDPINQTSSGLFYTYAMSGSQFAVTTLLESQKYKQAYNTTPQNLYFPGVVIQGNAPQVSVLYSPTGLVGYWPMDEGAGSTTADRSGSGNGGTWNGSTTNGSYYAGGKVGSWAGTFDGVGDWVSIATTTNVLDIPSPLSVSLWVYLGNVVTNQTIADLGTPGNTATGAYLQVINNNFRYCINNNTCATSGTINTNTWYALTGTYDKNLPSNQLKIYVNAVGTNTTYNSDVAGAGKTFFIGKHHAGLWTNGSIDDVRIYNRALSAADVQALYNAEK